MTSFENNLFRTFRRETPHGLPKHQAVIHALRAHNSSMIILATSDCKLAAYHVNRDTFDLMDPIDQYKGWVVKCELSLDNTFLVVLVEKVVCIYNARKRFVPVTTFRPHMFVVNDIAWSRNMTKENDKQWLATCSKDGTIRLWQSRDLLSKKLRNREEAEEPYAVLGVFQDPSKLYKAAAIDGDGHVESVVCLSFDNSDDFILSGGVDYRILMWKVSDGTFVKEFDGHLGVIMDIAFTLKGDRFASAGADKKVLLWTLAQTTPLMWLDVHTDVVENCLFIDDDYLVTSGRDSHFYVWDTRRMDVATDPFATILDKRCKRFAYRGTSHTRGWINNLTMDEAGEHICLVTSQLLNSFVMLLVEYHDYDWFQLKWYQRIFRRTKKEALRTSMGRRASNFLGKKRVGIRRADSKNFGRQISWSWSNTRLEKASVQNRKLVDKKDSRSFSRGLSGEVIKRSLSRGLSRGISRGISTDSLFDPSGYTLHVITEEDKHTQMVKKAAPKNVPSKQQFGERPGAKTSPWHGRIFTSKDNIEYEDEDDGSESGSQRKAGKSISRGNSFGDWFFNRSSTKSYKVMPVTSDSPPKPVREEEEAEEGDW